MSSTSFLAELTEGRIDFAGQETVDNLSRIVLVVATILAFCMGFAVQDLRVTFGVLGVCVLGLSLVVLPPWPIFNRHPVKWLAPMEEAKDK